VTPPRSAATTDLVTVAGVPIAMRVEGDGDALLLINGMTLPMRSWVPFTAHLSGRKVITFDSPGVGESPAPQMPLSIAQLAVLAAGVLDAAGVADADVLGFSHGGAIAQQLVNDSPHRVRRLVLVSTSCGMGATPSNSQASLSDFGTPLRGQASPYADALGLFWGSLAYATWSSIPFLGGIRARTLVVSGTDDVLVPPDNSRVLARRIPNASLVLMPGGHDLQRAEPAQALAQLVEDFLAG
jgi:pimeloyl-ACP methyl ester carboxylesterase